MFAITFIASDNLSAGPMISTPAGLKEGDHFRIAFVTDGTLTPVSLNIVGYNNFVTNSARNATYDGHVISWTAIASTVTVNAIDNIGTTGDPIYDTVGHLITSSDTSTGLWSGKLNHEFEYSIFGIPVHSGVYQILQPNVFTGTNFDGTSAGIYVLGGFQGLYVAGASHATDQTWVNYDLEGGVLPMIGISQDLTAVPEPSTAILAGIGSIAILFGAFRSWFRCL